LVNVNCPKEFIDVMPYTHVGFIVCCKYYWIEQVDYAYYQYYGLSKSEKEIWLKNKKRVFNSLMNYVRERQLREYREKSFRNWFFFPHNCDGESYLLDERPTSTPSPPLFRFFPKDLPKLIQYHIQRLEIESSLEHDNENSNDRKNDKNVNFAKTRKRDKKELLNKFNNMKGKNFRNKFSYKYG
jgi:hypothetical protein